MGMIERYGGGIQRIFEQCKLAGLPKPEFEQTQGGLRVHFQSPPQAIGGGVTEGVMRLYQLISKEPGQRVPSLAENMGTSPKNIERWLKQLKDEGKSGSPRFLRNLAIDR
jgi:ATP-dependent DNA helicase RecG